MSPYQIYTTRMFLTFRSGFDEEVIDGKLRTYKGFV